MINLIIHRNNTTAYIPLPAGRVKLAEHLSSIGIQDSPGSIRCTENKPHGYDISFSGDTEIERKMIGCVEPTDTLNDFEKQGIKVVCIHRPEFQKWADIEKEIGELK